MKSRKHKEIMEQRAVYALALALCALVGLYIYFVSASVMHVVIRKEVGKEIAQLSSEISTLEAQYIRKQHAVSDVMASQQGFVIAENKVFIDPSASTLVLSSNGE